MYSGPNVVLLVNIATSGVGKSLEDLVPYKDLVRAGPIIFFGLFIGKYISVNIYLLVHLRLSLSTRFDGPKPCVYYQSLGWSFSHAHLAETEDM